MTSHFQKIRKTFAWRIFSAFIAFAFSFNYIVPPVYAQGISPTVMNLPVPGTSVPLTPGFTPARIIGMTLHADNPLMFDFMVDPGETTLSEQALQDESLTLVKYFLASLTVPAEKLWVNLSPYEKDKIVPQEFGQTEMGVELLAQDYMLKQLTASLMNPEDELGKKFWDRVYEKAQKTFGTTEIPMNTFNKIWILPEKAVVYANGLNAFVIDSRLKVMMEEDYLALEHHSAEHPDAVSKDVASGISSAIIKEVLLPEIEKEVNEGKTFAKLRQIYNSLILAAWYKQNLQESLLGQVYADKAKTGGLTVEDKETTQKIYNQYLEAFQKGVYNFIKEDYDAATQQIIPRKYFSGGVSVTNIPVSSAANPALLKTFAEGVHPFTVSAGISSLNGNISYTMPFAPAESPEESASSPMDDPRIIVVDLHHPKLVAIYKRVFHGLGYTNVVFTANTKEALKEIQSGQFTRKVVMYPANPPLDLAPILASRRKILRTISLKDVQTRFIRRKDRGGYRDEIIAAAITEVRKGITSSPVKAVVSDQSSVVSKASDERRTTKDELGGIDLNPGNMELETNYGADRIQLPMPTIPLENIKIDGLVPVIIHVAPVTNLPLLLGLADEGDAEDTSGFQVQQPSPAGTPRRHKAREVEEVGLLN